MCCCGKPIINGQAGYSWDGHSFGVRPVNPPEMYADDVLLFDEPGRCGGLDCHSHHYRVVKREYGGYRLLVRHGGGDESIRLSGGKMVVDALSSLDSNGRYWLLSAMFYAQSDAAKNARELEAAKWRKAAAEKRIKTRKQRGTDSVRVTIV
jgi:hypothetical protein